MQYIHIHTIHTHTCIVMQIMRCLTRYVAAPSDGRVPNDTRMHLSFPAAGNPIRPAHPTVTL